MLHEGDLILLLLLPCRNRTRLKHTHKKNKQKTKSLGMHGVTDRTTLKPALTSFEVGCRGFFKPENKLRLNIFTHLAMIR